MATRPIRTQSSRTADPVPEPPHPEPDPAEAHDPSTTGELGSEGGSQGDLVQAEHVSRNASPASEVSSARASSGVALWVVTIIVVTVIIVWFIAHAMS